MLSFAKEMKTFTLGPLNPSVNVFHRLEFILNNHIPSNAHQLANGRLAVAVTRMADCKLTIISDFESKEDVINVSRFYRHTFKAKKDKEEKNSRHHLFFSYRVVLRLYYAAALCQGTAAWCLHPSKEWWVFLSKVLLTNSLQHRFTDVL